VLKTLPKKIHSLALDIDGTIFSSEFIIFPVYQDAIQEFSNQSNLTLIVPTHERIMKEIGKPVKTIFENLLPELSTEQRDAISDLVLLKLCERIKNGQGHYYPQVKETMLDLHARGIVLLLASNGRQPYVESIMRYLGVWDLLSTPKFIDNVTIHNKGDILKYYIQNNITTAEAMLMVGDRKSDEDAAIEAGCPFAWCAYGHADPGEIGAYDIRLDAFADLLKGTSKESLL